MLLLRIDFEDAYNGFDKHRKNGLGSTWFTLAPRCDANTLTTEFSHLSNPKAGWIGRVMMDNFCQWEMGRIGNLTKFIEASNHDKRLEFN